MQNINKEKLLKRMLFMVFFVFGLNSLAMKFYWYSMIWWFDMPMHFLGGFFVGLAWMFVFLPKDFTYQGGWGKSIFKIILGVLLIGVLWEIFEILVDKTISQNPFNTLDTISDICFDVAGGFTAIFYFLKRIMSV